MASATLVTGCDSCGQHAAARVMIGKFGMWGLGLVPDVQGYRKRWTGFETAIT